MIRSTHFLPVMLSAVMVLFSGGGLLAAEPSKAHPAPMVKASAGILVDAETGQVLWAKNQHARRPMASTTKIMTAVLALEYGKLDEIVTAPKGVDNVPEVSLHLLPGEKLTLRELLYAAMVRSANDAAVAIAHHIGGSVSGFARMMNRRAAQIGMKDTQFKNPNGLHESGHYSSAYDLMLLARHAVGLSGFDDICSTRRMVINRTKSDDRLLVSRADFLKDYQGADGIKTGYTRQAGKCFVGAATVDGWRLISVVLNSPDAGVETQAIMDYGFRGFSRVLLASAGDKFSDLDLPGGSPAKCGLVISRDLIVCVPVGEAPGPVHLEVANVRPPVNEGDVLGSVVAYVRGKAVMRVEVTADQYVREAPVAPRLGFLGLVGGGPMMLYGYRKSEALKSFRRSLGSQSVFQPARHA